MRDGTLCHTEMCVQYYYWNGIDEQAPGYIGGCLILFYLNMNYALCDLEKKHSSYSL
jgi:hypothetical protein